ncbi:hypothetical protein MPDQ_000379 [Monascus purpureus]|uniref:Nascent polypeptide-associated complex subunit alpha-like UBA domain-containing protein n=1 Tax=Monascus purpureus TaxID=5098 RepID=A0A507QPY1_MONPU|nr:hypothetical protein MPDQ_000379 [Monascus purpureus]BDD61283.1 hypothetical protein MAP00_006340 [Monascus purpureus]
MSDDIPSATNEPQPQPPKSKEDQKAAAALESLNTVTTDMSGDQPGAVASSSSTDREVLGEAMSRLEISGGQDGKKATVKVAAEDVGLLVDQLDLNKIKATELLKANEGDVQKAIKAFISPAVGA